jgi:hypothetical protein
MAHYSRKHVTKLRGHSQFGKKACCAVEIVRDGALAVWKVFKEVLQYRGNAGQSASFELS